MNILLGKILKYTRRVVKDGSVREARMNMLLGKILKYTRQVVEDGSDREARMNILLGYMYYNILDKYLKMVQIMKLEWIFSWEKYKIY